jgi:hypothetical protein
MATGLAETCSPDVWRNVPPKTTACPLLQRDILQQESDFLGTTRRYNSEDRTFQRQLVIGSIFQYAVLLLCNDSEMGGYTTDVLGKGTVNTFRLIGSRFLIM